MRHRHEDRHRGTRPVLTALLVLGGLLVAATPAVRAASPGAVVVVTASGEVGPPMADTIIGAIDSATASNAAALVIELDTPGGSLDATQRIVTAMLGARVPTIVWVAPAGGYAASAGTFITLAANLSWMAPGTRIGAASPIDGSGNDIPGILGEKVRNDAIAWIRSIAETRHRPVDWAASTVSDARSSSANEAVSLGAVDGIAATMQDVTSAAEGRTVAVAGGEAVLHLAGAPVEEISSNPLGGVLRLLVDPNIAFVLFAVGALALLFELQSPNLLSGIFGIVAIALSAVGFVNLPTDLAGLVLVAIGLILFALEPAIPSHGLLTIAGAIALVVGGFALYSQSDQFGPAVRVALPLLAVVAVTGAGFGLLITTTALRTRRMAAPRDSQPAVPLSGTIGEVRRPLEPLGSIYASGEEWSARAADDRSLPRGTAVQVVGSDGLIVLVQPQPSGLR